MSTDTPGSRADSDLGRMLTAEIKAAVGQETDRAIKDIFRKELIVHIEKVSADLAKQIEYRIAKEVGQIEARITEKVRRDLLESWTVAATALSRGAAPASSLKATMQPGSGAPESSGLPGPAAMDPAVKSKKVRLPLGPRVSTAGKIAAVVLALALLAAGYLIGRSMSFPQQRSEGGASPSPFVPTPTPPSPAELPITARVREDWLDVVMKAENQMDPGASLQDHLVKNPFSKQVVCWFSDDAQMQLERLARGSSFEIRQQLEDAFEPCFTENPELRDPLFAIFSAQATVANAFSRFGPEWDAWCAMGDEVTPPPLVADGHAGPATRDGMNLFLKCTGHGTELTIEPSSTTPQYLYVTYLALRELQR